MSGRFDYVKYNEDSAHKQADFKKAFEILDSMVEKLQPGRAKALVHTKLEEAYMWVGKAIRDHQVTMGQSELQEERVNS